MEKVVKVTVWWDESNPDSEGWFAECRDSDGIIRLDSMKIWFPLDLDEFPRDDTAEMWAALAAEFPGAEIDVKD